MKTVSTCGEEAGLHWGDDRGAREDLRGRRTSGRCSWAAFTLGGREDLRGARLSYWSGLMGEGLQGGQAHFIFWEHSHLADVANNSEASGRDGGAAEEGEVGHAHPEGGGGAKRACEGRRGRDGGASEGGKGGGSKKGATTRLQSASR
jgi:hypothetical protein